MRLAELAGRSGTPVSTIHYYRRLGLLPPFRDGGNGPYGPYGQSHLRRLRQIAELQATGGLSLAQIGRRLSERDGPSPPRSPTVPPAARLAAAAAEHFLIRGIDGVTMEWLAARLGVGKPTLYRHFAGRGALLSACLEGGHVAAPDCLERADAPEDPGPWLLDRLHLAFEQRARIRGVERVCRVLWDDDDPVLRSGARVARSRMVEGFSVPGLRRFARDGRLPIADASSTSQVLWGVVIGVSDSLEASLPDPSTARAPVAALRPWVPALWSLLGGGALGAAPGPLSRGGDDVWGDDGNSVAASRYGWGTQRGAQRNVQRPRQLANASKKRS